MSIAIDKDTDTAALPDRIRRFPFPFSGDTYRYSANVQPANTTVPTDVGSWGAGVIDIDEFYLEELADRDRILIRDPSRMQVLPHMRPAVWDTVATLLPTMAEENPNIMTFHREGNNCRWQNKLQNLDVEFTVGDDDSLLGGPLRFLGSQIQDDIVLLDVRDNTMWLDAGLVSFAADWSFGFDVGMSFMEIHHPVPRVKEEKIISRAEQFLLRLQPGEQYRRTNWTMTIGRRLDTSTETYPEWGPDRGTIATDPDMPDKLHLRVEVQHLIRLPHTGVLLFLIRSYLLPLRDIAQVPTWREKFGHVLAELPEDMAEYKGIIRYRKAASDWLLSG
ncbi:heme-dependent oxidative N-demethylase family protein [Paenarthrobacter sp. NPDC092416]|uniref:heme-dependent oxidative N-demethylase family protein n=1 Tax=Paenarthrobacter sp. NPDC092416 TaxID=3364386 RepID=UPI0037FC2A8D